MDTLGDKMVNFTIKKAGMLYVIIVLFIAGTYYYSLPSQDVFLRDIRWVSDRTALNLIMETEIPALFSYETEDIREKLPKEYRISQHTNSIPVDNTKEFEKYLEDFKEAVDTQKIPLENIEDYFAQTLEEYYYDELQYSAAITTIELQLVIEHLQWLSPSIPPIVVDTEYKELTVKTISILKNNVWRVKMVVIVNDDGEWTVPDEALVKYLGMEV
ncbi:MAG: hypothetical protein ACXQTP_06220 [Candidatus Methanofastidiosia archaeon]